MLMGLILTYSIIDLDRSPIAYQFWFIKYLIAMEILAPLIYLILKGLPRVSLAVILSLWLLNYWSICSLSLTAFTFFYPRSYFSSHFQILKNIY
jgi:hypothetical protein